MSLRLLEALAKPPSKPTGSRSAPVEMHFSNIVFTCKSCQKEVGCLALDFSVCERIPASSWLWGGAAAYTCSQCQAAFCNDCWQTRHVHFNFWTRWEKTICSECHRPFRPGLVFVPIEQVSLLRHTLANLGKPPLSGLSSLAHWAARIFSFVPLAFVLFGIGAALTEWAGTPARDIIVCFSLLLALLVAWRWELLGGALALCLISLHAYLSQLKEEPWFDFLVGGSALLFLSAGALGVATTRSSLRPKVILAARGLALLFVLLAVLSCYACFRVGKFNP